MIKHSKNQWSDETENESAATSCISEMNLGPASHYETNQTAG